MKYYGVLSIQRETYIVTYENYYAETDERISGDSWQRSAKNLDGTSDPSDDSIWYFIEWEEP